MEYLHNIPTNELQGQSRKENDLQRESPDVTYALREDKTEIRGRRFSELSLGPMPHQLYPPPVVRNFGRSQGRPFALLVLPRHLKLLRTTFWQRSFQIIG